MLLGNRVFMVRSAGLFRYYTKGSDLWARFSWATVFSWAGAQGCFATTRRALISGQDSLGQPRFHGQERRVVSAAQLPRFPGRLFPHEACSNASWQKYLRSEPSGLAQADLAGDRVIDVLCSAVEAGALPQYFFLDSRVECFRKKLEPRCCIRVSSPARKAHARLVHAGRLNLQEG